MFEMAIFLAVFASVLIGVFAILNFRNRRREIAQGLGDTQSAASGRDVQTEAKLENMISSGSRNLRHYFAVAKKNKPHSTESRLIRAGFFSTHAVLYFSIVRFLVGTATFILAWLGITNFLVTVTPPMAIVLATISSAISLILVKAVVDNIGKNKQISYRKQFPDFMDLLIVCIDAGLGVEAALDRVAREFMQTDPAFGMHLGVTALEVRAGSPMRDALSSFADRINVEEAKSLAILFRQSEELGTSVNKTLRTFSKEMRQTRLIKAEEKANALPIKMLFPLALFLFPVNLIIVIVPIAIHVGNMFLSLTPN